jgi:propanediol dehydratase small subunit
MPLLRVIIGVVIGAGFFAVCLLIVASLSLPPQLAALAFIIAASYVAWSVANDQRRRALQHYWDRACMGIRWRRRFPASPKSDIREFLDMFTDAFGFSRASHCYFSPDDTVLTVYRALYPDKLMADCLELETFCKMLEKRYGIDFDKLWHEKITLGEIYEQTHRVA